MVSGWIKVVRHYVADHAVIYAFLVAFWKVREDDLPHGVDSGSSVRRQCLEILCNSFGLAVHKWLDEEDRGPDAMQRQVRLLCSVLFQIIRL
jgi:hypothetical protein